MQQPGRTHTSGFRLARVREGQSLPLGWRHLTAVDISDLKAEVARRATPKADLLTLESCLLAWAALTTGRHPDDLLSLSICMVPERVRLTSQSPGMIGRGKRWYWWLPAGGPGQRTGNDRMQPVNDHVLLPATKNIVGLVMNCVRLRRGAGSGAVNLSGVAVPLFSHGHVLLAQVSDILAARHRVGSDRARRATTTVEALTRWLPAEMAGTAGGDGVPAAIVTNRIARHTRSAIHYGAVRQERIVKSYAAAIRSVDMVCDPHIPIELADAYLGDRACPRDTAVQTLVAKLHAALDCPDTDAAERHAAMTDYTVALLAFAFAHRGDTGTLPSLSAINANTELCWIDDKTIGGAPSRRLVWVCATARAQLYAYDAHLDTLQVKVSTPAAEAIHKLRRGNALPLFDMRSGRIEPLRPSSAIRGAMAVGRLRPNAGRHWLRGQLVGQCSTESLTALLDHSPVGEGSWDGCSTLDPAVYRADLARVIDPVLQAIGWTARMVSAV